MVRGLFVKPDILLAMVLVAPTGLSPVPARAGVLEDCLAKNVQTAPEGATVRDLRAACRRETGAGAVIVEKLPESLAKRRAQSENRTERNPYSLTAYKQNYVLPFTYASRENPLYAQAGIHMDHEEMKYQFSFRYAITQDDLFVHGDGLDFAYTQKSFWQTFNSEQSEPFRETDYNPEIFYAMPLSLRPLGGDTAVQLGYEHESNGLGHSSGVNLSRAWNRIYARFIFARDNYMIAVRPWYRIPESKNTSPTDYSGDDNPDIETYMGYFDLTAALRYRAFEFSVLARNNLRTTNNYGAIELGVSFPLYHRIRGYAQYFNGYGDSLIDYNQSVTRYGVGFMFTDIL